METVYRQRQTLPINCYLVDSGDSVYSFYGIRMYNLTGEHRVRSAIRSFKFFCLELWFMPVMLVWQKSGNIFTLLTFVEGVITIHIVYWIILWIVNGFFELDQD